MNRDEIQAHLRAFPYDRKEYWVITGGAMVLYGIREQTHDIDLGCTAELADRLEADGYLYRLMDNGKRWFRYGELIEVFELWLCDSIVLLEDVPVVSIRGLIEMKRQLGREKDQRDLKQIEAFLQQKHMTEKE